MVVLKSLAVLPYESGINSQTKATKYFWNSEKNSNTEAVLQHQLKCDLTGRGIAIFKTLSGDFKIRQD